MSDYTRRDWLKLSLTAGVSMALAERALFAQTQPRLMTRAIPSSGEQLPVVGLGSAASFSQAAGATDVAELKAVLSTLVERGATVFDTAPSYGASEEVAGRIAAEIGATNKIFWATKVNAAGRGGATPEGARAQIETSFSRLKKQKIDLIQVHNLADVPTHLAVLKDFKAKGRVKYIGVTTTSDGQYQPLLTLMKNEPLDFIGLDYAVDNRNVENDILPLAQERKIGVLVYLPFGRTRLFRRVGDRPVPDWAAEFDARTWAQFFIKYVISHPAVTAVTPATTQTTHLIDNLGGGIGRLPDEPMRKRMAALVDALPAG